MHRLKRWINEAVSSYEEQLKENPIETIAISLSWVFVIIIGLMAVFAYIKFIIDGGYSLSVARIKENGAFASANFTTGTIHIISNNVVWIILGIIIGVQTIVSIILLFAEKEIWKCILFVIDLIAIVFCFVKMVTCQNNSMSEEMRLIYSVVTLIAIIVFFKLLIDSDGSYVFLAEGLGLAAYNVCETYRCLLAVNGIDEALEEIEQKVELIRDEQERKSSDMQNYVATVIAVFGLISIVASVLSIVDLVNSGSTDIVAALGVSCIGIVLFVFSWLILMLKK